MPETDWRKRMNKVEEIHRAIAARLDLSEQRAAEREKRREKRRAELRAAGFREVSSEELLAAVKRLSNTVDTFLQAREAKRKNKKRKNKKS